MSEVSSNNWSETAASNTAAVPNGWPEGQLPGSINDCAREMMSALKKFWGRIQGAYASTGSSNAYVVTPTVALGAYVTGERYSFRANFANTGSATINISSLGAKTIKKMGVSGKTALVAGEIQDGQPVTVEYDGSDMVLVTPAASKILTGSKTIDLSNVDAGAAVSDTIAVTGAAVGDPVFLGVPSSAFNNQLFFQAYVSAADTVTITATSNSGSPIDPGSGTFSVVVFSI
jgi:hypothetical protein